MGSQKDFHNALKMNLLLMREHSIDTDVVLVSEDGQKFPVHKLLLKAASNYFVTMFTSDFKESKAKEVDIKSEGETLRIILDFIYFCPMDLTSLTHDLLRDVLMTSDMFQLEVLNRLCWNLLLKALTVDNYFVAWETAIMCNKLEMEENIVDFVINNLATISGKHKFYTLPVRHIQFILDRIKGLRIPLEMFIVERILSWVRNDETFRKEHLKTFFASMDLCTLPESYLQDLLHSDDDLIAKDNETIYAINSQLRMRKVCRTSAENHLVTTHQLVRFTMQYGEGRCESIDMDTGRKIIHPLPFVLKQGMCCAQYKSCIYFVDSADVAVMHKIPETETKSYGFNSVVEYCMESNLAVYKEPIPKAVCNAQACVVSDTLFVVGGDRGTTKSIQYYKIPTSTWGEISMPKNMDPMAIKICASVQDKLLILFHEGKDVYKTFLVDNLKCTLHSTLPKGFDLQPHLTVASSDTLYGFVRQDKQQFLCIYNSRQNKWTSKYIRDQTLPQFVYCVFEVNGRYCIACSKSNKIYLLDTENEQLQPMKLNAKHELGFFDMVPMEMDDASFEINIGFQKSLNQMKESARISLQFMDDELDDNLIDVL